MNDKFFPNRSWLNEHCQMLVATELFPKFEILNTGNGIDEELSNPVPG